MHERFGKGSFSGHRQPKPSNTWKDVHYLNAELRVVCQEDEQHQVINDRHEAKGYYKGENLGLYKAAGYPKEEVLPEDGQCRYLHEEGKKHRDQKELPTNFIK